MTQLRTDTFGPPPSRIGDFEIARELGRGSMGIVYEAIQLSLGRRVALKTFPAHGKPAHALERFRREASAAAKLVHPGIVPVWAVGEDKTFHYYAMQLVEGKTLRELIYSDKIALERAVRIARKIAEALEYAHKAGVIHRDIKPANIIVMHNDQPVITDFGLAKDTQMAAMTLAGMVLGTPTHMSPEQACGSASVDHRTDIYALGACLYEMLTYRLPFYGENLEELLEKVATEEPVRPRSIDRKIPKDLEAIVLQCLSKDPKERYQTAGELADDLGRFINKERVQAKRPSALRPVGLWVSKNPGKAAVFGIVVAVAVAVVAYAGASEAKRRSEVARLHDELEQAQARKDAALALSLAEKLIAVDPGNKDAHKLKYDLENARQKQVADARHQQNREEAATHVKAGHSAVERAQRTQGRDAQRAFDDALDCYGRALGLDPENKEARAGRARIYLQRAIDAERHGDSDIAAFLFSLVREHDTDGNFARQLRAEGSLSIRAAVPGAMVTVDRLTIEGDQTRRERVAGPAQVPHAIDALPVGSYLVEVTAESYASALVPVAIERDQRDDLDVRLLRPKQIPAGFAYIPTGPVRLGGDPQAIRSLPRERRNLPGFFLAQKEVTVAEFAEFVNSLQLHDAKELVPKKQGRTLFFQDETGKWRHPPAWSPDRPVTGVLYEAAGRYATWRGAKDGRPYRLPTELEWEKAARGADGRSFPWGEAPVEGRANVATGAEGVQPKAVGGTATDVSIYGVFDMIGNASEWTSSVLDTRLIHRIVRGGSYVPAADPPRAAARYPTEIANPPEHTGFRLACDLPEE